MSMGYNAVVIKLSAITKSSVIVSFRLYHSTYSHSLTRQMQVFSTEFISAMHVDESEILTNYVEITDPWRERYHDPIQVS